MSKLYFLLLLLVLACNTSKETCQEAIVDENILKLFEYNSSLHTSNYTGVADIKFNQDTAKTEYILHYSNGSIIDFESFYLNGNPKMSVQVKCNSKNGRLKRYFPNGGVAFELDYRLGKRHGIGKSYYPSGQIQKVRTFKNDRLEGISYEISEQGDTTAANYFELGVPVK